MTRAALGVVMLAALLSPGSSGARPVLTPTTYSYKILNAPTSSDERAIRTLGIQPRAQALSDKLFGSLSSLLGGTAPRLNFVPTGDSLLLDADTSANIEASPRGAQGSINVDPLAVEALTNFKSAFHDSGVNQYPHEMAHLRQTQPTLASLLAREGGAQAFADLVTPTAAKQAGIPYDAAAGNVDGNYAPYVQAVQQAPYGRNWILGTQFGKTAPPVWP